MPFFAAPPQKLVDPLWFLLPRVVKVNFCSLNPGSVADIVEVVYADLAWGSAVRPNGQSLRPEKPRVGMGFLRRAGHPSH